MAPPPGRSRTSTAPTISSQCRAQPRRLAKTFCVVTDDHGDVLTSKDPTGGAAKWTIDQVDPGRWLVAVSCASTKLCIATDNNYDVVVGST